MKTSYINYDIEKSVERIKSILKAKNSNFQKLKSIPNRNKLTFTNGFYVEVAAIFMDIRQSSKLTGEHKRPKLARLYRSYISEAVAILNSYTDCKEVNIVGDCISGIFEGKYQSQIDYIFDAAVQLNTLVKIVNYMLKKNDIVQISVGIGISTGKALMIKAGFNGSSINDVVWMGDVVNQASNLCGMANKEYDEEIIVCEDVYTNLSKENKKYLSRVDMLEDLYGGNVLNTEMDDWYKENCNNKKVSLFEWMNLWE